MKYIDAEKLIADIVKKKNQLVSLMNKIYYAANYKEWEAELNSYNKITSLIESLRQEQPGVDLEEEIGHWIDKLDDKYCTLVEDYSVQDIKNTAHHFYELGLKARKEE